MSNGIAATTALMKTKTTWGGVLCILGGAALVATGVAAKEGIALAIFGIQTIFLRDAARKIENKLK